MGNGGRGFWRARPDEALEVEDVHDDEPLDEPLGLGNVRRLGVGLVASLRVLSCIFWTMAACLAFSCATSLCTCLMTIESISLPASTISTSCIAGPVSFLTLLLHAITAPSIRQLLSRLIGSLCAIAKVSSTGDVPTQASIDV